MTSVQAAREALGQRLRELRRQAGLSGKELAASLGWQASKISKIELGRQTPAEADVIAWTKATDASNVRAELVNNLHALELQYAEWRRQLRTGTRARQRALVDLDARTRTLRAFESTHVPGLLQTAEYARHRLAEMVMLHDVPNDVAEGVRARMSRQQILYQPGRRFHFVLTEAVLRYQTCPPEVMAGQLDRLLALISLPTVQVGVIPFSARYSVSPLHGFWIHGDELVLVETLAAELTLTQPQEIQLYARIFDRMARVAHYGAEARAIVARAPETLAERDE